MRYMFLIWRDEERWAGVSEQEQEAIRRKAGEFTTSLPPGVYLGGGPLQSPRTAATVRLQSGKAVTTDGPFAETKEQFGGYNIVEVGSLDEAMAIAVRHPLVLLGYHSIEVRALREDPCVEDGPRPGDG